MCYAQLLFDGKQTKPSDQACVLNARNLFLTLSFNPKTCTLEGLAFEDAKITKIEISQKMKCHQN